MMNCPAEDFANARLNPTYRTVQHWYEKWRSTHLGPRTGQGNIPLGAHDLPLAKDIVSVDSTSSCDPENHCITFLLTPCAAGAATLGNAFDGKGFPTIFLTDNSDAEIALNAVWPNSKSLLCIFHILQDLWRWLWDEIGSMYSKWCRYVTVEHWTYKECWCLAWRDHTNRGHNTSNLSEVFFQEFSNDRNPTARKYFEKIIKLCDYASKDEIYVENEEYYVPGEENKQLMYCVKPTIGICSCKVRIHEKFCKHQGIIYKYFNKIGINFPLVTIEDKYLIAKLALGEKVTNKIFYKGLLPAEVVHTQSPISHDIHQDSNKKSSTESMQIVKEHNPNSKKQEYKIHTERQFNIFLATAGTSSLSLRHRDGASIKVQPTTIARRRPGITRGTYFTLGRPATSDSNRPKKKPRNLLDNIKNCVTNAKSH
ncbi:SWIM-type domain-containing protein [Aphis craccivora]|uniref:SWIM-type domain-containing protein n=1 Tax=Aphis craccivora TaxID=307492 RepID=A0A6G0ZLB4_APHCR|nr:SWIM-type domain-containing protein [Aphis craccivora]